MVETKHSFRNNMSRIFTHGRIVQIWHTPLITDELIRYLMGNISDPRPNCCIRLINEHLAGALPDSFLRTILIEVRNFITSHILTKEHLIRSLTCVIQVITGDTVSMDILTLMYNLSALGANFSAITNQSCNCGQCPNELSYFCDVEEVLENNK